MTRSILKTSSSTNNDFYHPDEKKATSSTTTTQDNPYDDNHHHRAIPRSSSRTRFQQQNPSTGKKSVSFVSDGIAVEEQDHRHQSRRRRPLMNEEEEDVFDPSSCSSNVGDVGDDNNDNDDDDDVGMSQWSNVRIQEAKSQRALKRIVGGDDGRNVKGRHVYEGEEEVDERYSLLHDSSQVGQVSQQPHGQQPRQCPIEPFNLTSEREDGMGYFDGDTYIFRRSSHKRKNHDLDGYEDDDDDEDGDTWMNHVFVEKDREPSQYRMKQDKEKKNYNNNNINDNGNDNNNKKKKNVVDDNLTREQVYRELSCLLNRNDSETILEALSRYGSIMKRQRGSQSQHQRQRRSQGQEQDTPISGATQAFYRLTELSNLCMMKFDDGHIYDRNRTFFHAQLLDHQHLDDNDDDDDDDDRHKPVETNKRYKKDVVRVGSYFDVMDNASGESEPMHHPKQQEKDGTSGTPSMGHCCKPVQWEYRGNQDHGIHGPFSTEQMLAWIQAGYFVGSMAVDVRMVVKNKSGTDTTQQNNSSSNTHEHSTKEVMDDLLGDLEESDNDMDSVKDGDKDKHQGRNHNHNTDQDDKSNASSKIEMDASSSSCSSNSGDGGSEWQRSDQVNFSLYL